MGILISMSQYDNYKYITSSGLIVPDTSTVLDQVTQDFKNALGQELDTTPETPQGRLIQLMTDYRTNTLALNALNANQINLRYATGRFLDAIGAFYGVERIFATPTRVLASVTGVANTVIPQGSQAQTTAGDVFYAENDITIGVNGTATGYFLSLEVGQIPCEVNTLTQIVNAVLGWETINNSSSATIGTDVESDTDFRIRIQNSRYNGISLLESIKTKVSQIDNVKSLWAYDNYTNASITYEGVSIPAHSICVVVDGGQNSEIARALFEVKTGGTGYTAITDQDVEETVIDGAFGVPYVVTFNRPEVVDFKVAVQVKNVNYSGSDLVSDVKQAIINWANGLVEGVDGLKIGQDVSPFEISAAISDQIPELYVKNCQIALLNGVLGTSELTFTISQVGQILDSNITVTVL